MGIPYSDSKKTDATAAGTATLTFNDPKTEYVIIFNQITIEAAGTWSARINITGRFFAAITSSAQAIAGIKLLAGQELSIELTDVTPSTEVKITTWGEQWDKNSANVPPSQPISISNGGATLDTSGLAQETLSLAVSPNIFGDGSDGDVTIAGTVTLTRNMQYDDLIVPAGQTLRTGNFSVLVKGSLTGAGTIEVLAGVAAASATLKGGGAGGAPGNPGASVTPSLGGGNGGTGNAGANAGGIVTDFPQVPILSNDDIIDLDTFYGGAGGGGGSAGIATGHGGGVLFVAAKTLNWTGTFKANGGAGAPNNAGGGGGGVIVLLYNLLTALGTTQVNGGAKDGTGVVGNPGRVLQRAIS